MFFQNSKSAPQRSQQMISPLLRAGLLLGIALHLAGFLVFRLVSNPLPDRRATSPYVGYVSADSLASDHELEEQAALFDSAPLFIPTHWNASQIITFDSTDTLLTPFSQFGPDVDLLNELEPSSFLVAQNVQVEAPLDLLASRFWRFFAASAQSSTAAFPDTLPLAEVSVVGQQCLSSQSVTVELNYTTAFPVDRAAWYYLRLSGSGLVLGGPTLGQSSGNTDFDQAVMEWLGRPEVLSQFPKGYLLIQVYPW
jgi:hypothetical protein